MVRATIRGKNPNEEDSLKEDMNSTIAARDIAGIPNRKENLAASPLSQPEIRAVERVIPDLETPGKIAKAWDKPIKRLFE